MIQKDSGNRQPNVDSRKKPPILPHQPAKKLRGNRQPNVDRCKEPPTLPHHSANKRRDYESTLCKFDHLPEEILHDIFSRLSILNLLITRRTCLAWHHMVSSCKMFQELYDQKNEESGIALGSPTHKANEICLFRNNSNRWYFLQCDCQPGTWFLQGAVDGLMLLVSSEGKLAVVNPLTKQHRLLPDTMVTSSLNLESCLMKKVWAGKTTPLRMRPCLNIVVDPADQKKFKVMVCGELMTGQVHILVYSSATDKWMTKLCSKMGHTFFRKQPFSTVDGNTIYFTSKYFYALLSYNTETGLLVNKQPDPTGLFVLRVQTIGIVRYRNQTYLLGVRVGREGVELEGNVGPRTASVGLWHVNRLTWQLDILTQHKLKFPSVGVVAAYDGEGSVTIIPSAGSVVMLDLDTKEWRMTSLAPTVPVTAPRKSVWAFHMKLKISTAL